MTNIIEFGAKPNTDSTENIQAAVDATPDGDILTVPAGDFRIDATKGADNYASGGVFLKSNITLALSAGARLIAETNSKDHYTILTVKNCIGTKIFGPGQIVGDRDTHPQDPGRGQFGFGIAILGGSRDIIIGQKLGISKLWGDGLTILDGSNIKIDQLITADCRRQNMSVIAVDGLSLTNSTFLRAQYSGLDLECDLEAQTIKNVLVQYCNFRGTVEGPAHIGVGSPVGKYSKIVIKDCQYDLNVQPIFVHDRAGDLGTPWWAFLMNRIFKQGLNLPTYRYDGYPQSWTSKT